MIGVVYCKRRRKRVELRGVSLMVDVVQVGELT